jgi:hypothetical protein
MEVVIASVMWPRANQAGVWHPGSPGAMRPATTVGSRQCQQTWTVTDGLPLTVGLSTARPGNRPGLDLN